jgi:hypothetical protein
MAKLGHLLAQRLGEMMIVAVTVSSSVAGICWI